MGDLIETKRGCANPGCGKGFEIKNGVENQKFCSSACRFEWHGKKRKRALKLFNEMEQGQSDET